MQVYLRKEQLSLDVIKQCRVRCPTPQDKQKVLRDSIFPNCEKLGQTIIFVGSRANAHGLHRMVSLCLLHLPSKQVLRAVKMWQSSVFFEICFILCGRFD